MKTAKTAKQRLYIDINAQFGRSSFKEKNIPYREDQLVDDMSYFRIHAGCISSLSALAYSYIAGNREILTLARQNPRVIPLAVTAAIAPFESGEGIGYFKRLQDEGAKGFLLAPAAFSELFTPFFYQELMDFLEKQNIPAFIRMPQADFAQIIAMASAFPKVRFVVLGSGWGDNRVMYTAMKKLKNLYMDIGCNQANDLLVLCKEQGFLERVLFGTDYPNRMPGGAKALVEYSDITEEEKDMVSHKNACRLLGLDCNAIQRYEDDLRLDEVAAAMDSGLPLSGFEVIDCHTHMANDGDRTVSSNMMLHSGFDDIIPKLDRMGIDLICTAPWEGISSDGIHSNEIVLEGMKKYPGRILGYACCNLNYEEDLKGVYSYHEKHHFPGVKPYWPFHKRPLCDPLYKDWFEYANKHRLIMLVHSDSLIAISDIKLLVKKYPDIAFVLAHTGASYDVARAHVEIAKSAGNVWLEITYTALCYGMIEYLAHEVGPDRVLFGSDLPMRDPAPQMAWVAYAKIPIEDKVKIFGNNFRSLLERCTF